MHIFLFFILFYGETFWKGKTPEKFGFFNFQKLKTKSEVAVFSPTTRSYTTFHIQINPSKTNAPVAVFSVKVLDEIGEAWRYFDVIYGWSIMTSTAFCS